MSDSINLPLMLAAAFITSASPGPATLAIAGTSMTSGRRLGLVLASGVTTGSLTWSVAAAFGLGAVMLANAWLFEAMRYLGAGYLLYLAYRSGRSALSAKALEAKGMAFTSARRAYGKGLALHLTNPKAVLFFGSVYSIGIPASASLQDIVTVILAVGIQSFLIFHGYALLFSSEWMIRRYTALRRWFESVFALAFAAAGVKILTARFL